LNPYSYGFVTDSRFERIWNSPEAAVFRRMAAAGLRHPYCSDCYYVDVRAKNRAQDVNVTGAAAIPGRRHVCASTAGSISR